MVELEKGKPVDNVKLLLKSLKTAAEPADRKEKMPVVKKPAKNQAVTERVDA